MNESLVDRIHEKLAQNADAIEHARVQRDSSILIDIEVWIEANLSSTKQSYMVIPITGLRGRLSAIAMHQLGDLFKVKGLSVEYSGDSMVISYIRK